MVRLWNHHALCHFVEWRDVLVGVGKQSERSFDEGIGISLAWELSSAVRSRRMSIDYLIGE